MGIFYNCVDTRSGIVVYGKQLNDRFPIRKNPVDGGYSLYGH